MPFYVAFLQGASPLVARPVFASSHPDFVQAVCRVLLDRLAEPMAEAAPRPKARRRRPRATPPEPAP